VLSDVPGAAGHGRSLLLQGMLGQSVYTN
jgi:hypothetical protein